MTTTAPAPLISRNPVFSTSLSLRLTLSSQLPLSFRLPLSFLLPLSFRAQREISPPLPLLPTVISSEARNLSRYPCCHCHFERSEKSFPLRLNPITSAHHVISSAARNLSLFSLPPSSPHNARDPARAAHAGPIHVCSQCHAPVPVSRGDARGNPGAPAQGGPRFQACRRSRGSGSIPPQSREGVDFSCHTCYHSRKTPCGVWARAPWTAEHVGKGSQPSREEITCSLLARVVSGSWSPAW